MFRTLGLRSLCIVDKHNHIVGIVTRADLTASHILSQSTAVRKSAHEAMQHMYKNGNYANYNNGSNGSLKTLNRNYSEYNSSNSFVSKAKAFLGMNSNNSNNFNNSDKNENSSSIQLTKILSPFSSASRTQEHVYLDGEDKYFMMDADDRDLDDGR